MAETVDKFEEDFLGAASASIRGRRRAEIRFGEPIIVREPGKREAARRLVLDLEQRVQSMLDDTYRQASRVPA
jgi:hypothetical protein